MPEKVATIMDWKPTSWLGTLDAGLVGEASSRATERLRVNSLNTADEARRDLIFVCAETGAIVAMTYSAEDRPALLRAAVFLSSGEVLWVDPQPGSPLLRSARFERREREVPGRYDLRMSAQATWLNTGDEVVADEPVEGRRLPVVLDATLEPASLEVPLGDQAPQEARPARVVLVQGSGTLAVGSVIHRIRGLGWSSLEPADDAGRRIGCRARAVFQDGSALFAVDRRGDAGAGDVAAAIVINTQINRVPVHQFAIEGSGRGPAGKLQWTGGGRSPVDVTGEIRHFEQYLTVVRPTLDGSGWLAQSCTPFVFVRSGITGLGLVERESAVNSAHAPRAVEDELPDPY
jgi:hypothetical protein